MGDLQQELSEIVMTNAAQLVEVIKVTGDTAQRYRKDSNGKLEWGSGSAPPDTNLYRSSAGVLKTDGILSNALGSQDAIEAASTGEAATIAAYGISLVASSSAKSQLLTNPTAAGILKSIYCTNGSSTNAILSVYTASTSVAFDAMGSSGSAPLRKIVFDNSGGLSEAVELRSYARATDGTLMWGILGLVGTSGAAVT